MYVHSSIKYETHYVVLILPLFWKRFEVSERATNANNMILC